MYFLSRRQLRRLGMLVAALALLAFVVHYDLGGAKAEQPTAPPSAVRIRIRRPPMGWALAQVSTRQKAVALTFDDGPDPVSTPEVLKVLRQYGARATFFVLGLYAEKYPDLLRQIAAAGSEVASHGYSHRILNRLSPKAAEAEIQRTAALIQKAVGYRPRFYRPPYGELTDAMSRYLLSQGEVPTLWTWYEDSMDWRRPGVKRIVHNILYRLKPGVIILMHDGGGGRKKQTIEALRLILPILRQDGYHLVTLSELVAQGQKPLPIPLRQVRWPAVDGAGRTAVARKVTPPRPRSN